jgi:hypothetical protein
LLVVSGLLAAMPVVFGLIRAVSTGDDVRYLWLAGASILGSWIVARPLGRGASADASRLVRCGIGAVAAGAACAAVTGIALGARPGPGIAIVAVAFGLCTGTGAMVASLARP